MSLPPHLPPPTSDIAKHHSWQRLKLIGVATFFGLLAGVAGAAVVVALVSSETTAGYGFVITTHPVATAPTLDAAVLKKIDPTLLTVYSRATTLGNVTTLDPADRLADGVVGVSSGWLVAAMPNYDGHYKDWRMLGSDGALYRTNKVLFDHRLGLAFVSLMRVTSTSDVADAPFKVAVFSSVSDIPTTVFVFQGGRFVASTLLTNKQAGSAHLEMVPGKTATFSGSFIAGSVVVDGSGEMLGFVADANMFVPAVTVPSLFTGIDDRNSITYLSWGAEGWYSDEKPLLVNGDSIVGFVVSKVAPTSLLRRGDIITEVNGRPTHFGTVWYTQSEPSTRLTVLRSGKKIVLMVVPIVL